MWTCIAIKLGVAEAAALLETTGSASGDVKSKRIDAPLPLGERCSATDCGTLWLPAVLVEEDVALNLEDESEISQKFDMFLICGLVGH